MKYFFGIGLVVVLSIAAVSLWFKEYEDTGWNKKQTDHRYRIISIIFATAAMTIIYHLFFK